MINAREIKMNFLNLNFTYTFCMNWVCGKEKASKQRRLWGVVQHPTLFIIGESSNQYGKHIGHKGRYDSMEDDVQHVEANRMQASHQEVVQSEKGRGTVSNGRCTVWVYGGARSDRPTIFSPISFILV